MLSTSIEEHALVGRDHESPPTVSVVIPCRNERDHIETVIKSVLAQKPPSGDFEVIVADGMSNDGTRDALLRLANEDPRVRVVDNPGLIVSTGLNAAIRKSRGAVIIRMDAHTDYAQDYICRCLEVLRATEADNVGGPALTRSMGVMQAAISAAYHSSFSTGGARFHKPNYNGFVDTVTYGCWRRELFERIGLFDEELVRNQDDEFNLRLTKAGGKIWQSSLIKSWYRPRASLVTLFQQYKQYGYWKVRVIMKHKMPASWRHIVPGCFFLMLILFLFSSLVWPAMLPTWIALVAVYGLANLVAGVVTASQSEWKLFPFLPLVFACYHLAYGYGFLLGVCDFIILRRRPRSAFGNLTRDSA